MNEYNSNNVEIGEVEEAVSSPASPEINLSNPGRQEAWTLIVVIPRRPLHRPRSRLPRNCQYFPTCTSTCKCDNTYKKNGEAIVPTDSHDSQAI